MQEVTQENLEIGVENLARNRSVRIEDWKKRNMIPGYKFCERELVPCLNQFPAQPWHKKYCSKEHQQSKYRGR